MAAGTPVLCIAQSDSDEARLVDRFDAGVSVEQGDTDGVVEAIGTWRENRELVDEQGTNAREAFEAHFTKDRSVERYHRMLTGRPASSEGASDR